ncbi:hypothetical protein [Syntrophobacter fumaroxidans]|nr:hypothetical protein [Syntrophobacter fumaroxidans]
MMEQDGLRNSLADNIAFYAAVLLAATALKWHDHPADGEVLSWSLSPTAALVDFPAGIHFEKKTRAGFIGRRHGIIPAPAYAGVNFPVIVFAAPCF